MPVLAIVGRPNAGKSALFNRLSGEYAAVSNYPGTTVEVARARWEGRAVIDTPGMNTMLVTTEEEAVSRRLLFAEKDPVIVHVADSRNPETHIPLTIQLIEAGLRVVIVMNMADEAAETGVRIDPDTLSRKLGIPVAVTSCRTGEGIDGLKEILRNLIPAPPADPAAYPVEFMKGMERVSAVLPPGTPVPNRVAAMLLLEGDEEMMRWLVESSPEAAAAVLRERSSTQAMFTQPLSIVAAMARQRTAVRISRGSVKRTGTGKRSLRERIGDALTRPLWGSLAAAAFLYFGMYLFVGKFGAGVVVDFLEKSVFLKWINPASVQVMEHLIPWQVMRDLFTGEFGIITLGIRYAFAIILPLVTLFFLVFAVIEDSGYLPRLAMLLDGAFKKLGLSGRAVIPIILGFGCDTMATLVTRTLATRRERLIATLLLALAIPCSAQMGVILSLLQGHPAAFTVWGTVIGAVFVLVGFLGARILPGRGAIFFLEIPPMRWPSPVNVWRKTAGRVIWYMEEVLPLFIYISAAAWAAEAAGVFSAVVSSLAVPLSWMGLPAVSAPAFLFGFIRRDYGAAGLYDLHNRNALSMMQLAIATTVLTLFLPCMAQFMIMGRERGWRTAVAITCFVGISAFAAGLVLARLLPLMGAGSW